MAHRNELPITIPHDTDTRRQVGPSLWLMRVLWLIVLGVYSTVFAASVPNHFTFLTQAQEGAFGFLSGALNVENIARMTAYGLTARGYAVYIVSFEVALVAVYILVAVFIVWRRSGDRHAILVSMFLIIGGSSASAALAFISTEQAGWLARAGLLNAFTPVLFVLILFTSPDGHFRPRWTWRISAAVIPIFLITGAITFDNVNLVLVTSNRLTYFMLYAMSCISATTLGIWAQARRYRFVSDRSQRQQTKWLVFGFALLQAAFIGRGFFYIYLTQAGDMAWLVNMVAAVVYCLALLALPVSIVFSVLRYRLYEIDVIIRRTLTYSILTTILAAMYFSGIIVVQHVFRAATGEIPEVAIVLSTLAIATLFSPLRHRAQDVIDRRFYRRKYNAEQTLARFNQSLRDEVDIETLKASLLNVVQETMQPTSIALWRPETPPK